MVQIKNYVSTEHHHAECQLKKTFSLLDKNMNKLPLSLNEDMTSAVTNHWYWHRNTDIVLFKFAVIKFYVK